jgi:hypothetical protein
MRRRTGTEKGQSHMHEHEVVLERRPDGLHASGHGLHRCGQPAREEPPPSSDKNVHIPSGTGRGARWRRSEFCRPQRWRRGGCRGGPRSAPESPSCLPRPISSPRRVRPRVRVRIGVGSKVADVRKQRENGGREGRFGTWEVVRSSRKHGRTAAGRR